MSRLPCLIGAVLATVSLSAPVFAADYIDGVGELRGSYPEQWGFSDEPNPLEFEAGIRYWYALGSHQMSAFGDNYSSSDVSHILELHFRIDDNSTSTYLKGQAGYAAIISGTYQTPEFGSAQAMQGGQIGYAGADFGYTPFELGSFQFGAFGGYQYLVDAPDMGRSAFVTSAGAGDSTVNTNEIHALRLGVVAKADLGGMFDINAEAAIIPYASLDGTYGAFSQLNFVDGGLTYEQGSAGIISGRLYGASGEIMLGIHPTDNLTVRLGGRAWYLTGEAQVAYTAREVGTPSNEQGYIATTTGLEFFRFGAVGELTGSF